MRLPNFNYQLLIVLVVLLVILVVLYLYQYYCNTEPYTTILAETNAEQQETDEELTECERLKNELIQKINTRKVRIKALGELKIKCHKDVEDLRKTLASLKPKYIDSPK